MPRTRTSDFRMALALCSSCGLGEPMLSEAAHDVVVTIRRRPRPLRKAAAVQTARRWLARQLGRAQRSLPGNLVELKAVGQYERQRRRYEQASDPVGLGASMMEMFDYHDRRFAVENGVCPRCSRPGRFGEQGGSCACGFGYGEPPVGPALSTEAA